MTASSSQSRFVFVCGLHRSGTTVLARTIQSHSAVSGFQDTGFPKDEGQFLQDVFDPAYKHGGPGKFGFDPEMHLTEHHSLLTPDNIQRLRACWMEHWDTSREVLLEKSPPNLLKMRFLQAAFPEARFIVLVRHPVVTALATQKWSETSLVDNVKHWTTCHRIYLRDRPHIKHLIELRYEDVAAAPKATAEQIWDFLDLPAEVPDTTIFNANEKYRGPWEGRLADWRKFLYYKVRLWTDARLAERAFGYDLYAPNWSAGAQVAS